ncbi:MAG TPA: helix-turn-helix domain-containing GNAT family N-acetyltransferase [Gemmatimonadaceae bacterium]|nr:helix-turn-helix domain-containing GNAT family N-acetyltransferase [Gemmatimonadaceae bacterium]
MGKAILSAPPASHVRAVRAFNRFYTQRIGVLQRGVLQSPYSLTEVRVLYELANGADLTASDVRRILGLDPGYLSRILRSFERSGMLSRERSKKDGRRSLIRLTGHGRKVFSALNARQSSDVEKMLQSVPDSVREELVGSMQTIQKALNSETVAAERVSLRAHGPGDMGWVMFRHGILYEREYGWDERFEALVGEIVVNFVRDFDAKRERCWIAEIDGERVGSVFLVKDTATAAKLRLLLVEPAARGHGVGKLLVSACIDFARKAGYRKLTLWTNSVLDAARHIYESVGFELVKEEKHSSFGHNLTGQYWSLDLSATLVSSASVHQSRLDRHA